MAKVQLKTMCLLGDASKLIVDTAIMLQAIKTGTFNMHDLSGFYLLIDQQNLCELRFPDFTIYRRKNLTCKKLSCSPMHILDLGKTYFYHI